MLTLIEQLQLEAMDHDVRITDLLRKAKLVAVKLGLRDAAAWVDHELDGYPEGIEHPDYRNLIGQPRFATQYVGLRPLQFADAELDSMMRTYPLRNAVSQIEALLTAKEPCIPFEGPRIKILQDLTGEEILAAGLYFGTSEVARILDAVRTRVFNWVLELEAAGVRGEGQLAFSKRDRDAAASVTYNISGGTFSGAVGPVSGGTVHATIHQLTPELLQELHNLAQQVRALAVHMGLASELRAAVEAAAATVAAEAGSSTPDRGKLRTALATIKTIAEQAAGNLVASGIGQLLPPLIAALGGQ